MSIENFNKEEHANPFTDTERRKVAQKENVGTSFLSSISVIFKSKEPRSEYKLAIILEELARKITKDESKKYPFLKKFGKEDFDTRVLSNVVHSFNERIKKEFNSSDKTKRWNKGETQNLKGLLDNVYKDHIPVYTDMVTELEKRSSSQEVYLGRDASFLYYARRAYLWGKGEKTKDQIRYIVFPTKFTNFPTDEKTQYLQDNKINTTDINDTVFIDTGKAGSVPENIIRSVFNISDPKEIDSHILLMGGRESRRVKLKAASMSLVSTIESAPKTIFRPSTLLKNEASGKLVPNVTHAAPEEILKHEAMKYLIMRHFYLQGKSERK